ncbi:hypothetical protein ACH5RR_009456 [Cinchona calisaya]|uniref:DUF4283 domain-containing protein n=1 Tax=Cinchona calisaya TaxID=153742 RepID=A0ABD3AG34_9GENT
MWVQLWNIPIHLINRGMGMKLGNIIGQSSGVIIPSIGGKEGRHVKVLTKIDITQPLIRGDMVTLGGNKRWIDFTKIALIFVTNAVLLVIVRRTIPSRQKLTRIPMHNLETG